MSTPTAFATPITPTSQASFGHGPSFGYAPSEETDATALLRPLRQVRRRVLRLRVIDGAARVLATAAAVILSLVTLDYLLHLPAWPRLVLLLVGLGGVLAVVIRHLVRPLSSLPSLTDLAGRVEATYPHLQDRFRSAAAFAMSGGVPHESAGLRRAVIADATRDLDGLNVSRILDTRPIARSLVALIVVGLVLLVATLAATPTLRAVATARLLYPFGDAAWPKSTVIELAEVPPSRLPAGLPLEVAARLSRGDRPSARPTLFWTIDDGPAREQLLSRRADGTYVAEIETPDVLTRVGPDASRLRAWVVAGDDRVDLPAITLVERLALSNLTLQADPPPYVVAGVSRTLDLSESSATVAEASGLTFHAVFNKPLANGTTPQLRRVGGGSTGESAVPPVAWRATDRADVWTGTWTATRSDGPWRFSLVATDSDGFASKPTGVYDIVVMPDRPPAIRIERPGGTEERTPDATLPVVAFAEDDLGVRDVTFVVRHLDVKSTGDDQTGGSAASPTVWRRTLVDGERPLDADVSWAPAEQGTRDAVAVRRRLGLDWHLHDTANLRRENPSDVPGAHASGAVEARVDDALSPRPGDVLEYSVFVRDYYTVGDPPVSHDPVESRRLRLVIISQQDLTRQTVDGLRVARERLESLRADQRRLLDETADLRERLSDLAGPLDDADRAAAERLRAEQSNVAGATAGLARQLDALSRRLAENASPEADLARTAEEVRDALHAAAEGSMQRAVGGLREATQGPPPAEAVGRAVDTARSSQQDAAAALERASDRLGQVGTLRGMTNEFADLLRRQQELAEAFADAAARQVGKAPQQIDGEARRQLDALAERQSDLADATAARVQDLKTAGESMKSADPSSADAMASAAADAERRQIDAAQRQAAGSMSRNQRTPAAQQHAAAAAGLQAVLDALDRAEREALAELRKRLAEIEEQVRTLVRRQAGHNLDTLALPEASAPAVDVSDTLRRLADRDAQAGDRAEVAAGQIQTERNARDIGRTVAGTPGLEETASLIVRAAGRMERAIVELRAARPAAAYDPAQVEALETLLLAMAQTERRRQEADRQAADRQKEDLVRHYTRLREEQGAVGAETTRVDAARSPKGRLNRVEAVALNRLAARQEALQNETAALAPLLKQLGSIVYDYANADLVTRLNAVATDLSSGKSGQTVRNEQAAIVQALDRMIEHLTPRPPDEPFAEGHNAGGDGGGGGASGPQIPSGAELQMLRTLQSGLNDQTVAAADAPNVPAGAENVPETVRRLGTRQAEFRGLLDRLVSDASHGQMSLGPEPRQGDPLPEEADEHALDDAELDDDLLGAGREGRPEANDPVEATIRRLGGRMSRAGHRLTTLADAGRTTQTIQQRIVEDFDTLIAEAARQRPQDQPPGGTGDGSPQGQPGSPSQADAAQTTGAGGPQNDPQRDPDGASDAAADASDAAAGTTRPDGEREADGEATAGPVRRNGEASGTDLREGAAEWGRLTPRQRQAILEGRQEEVIESYRRLSEDYWRGVRQKATER